jgi:hypothetical protein
MPKMLKGVKRAEFCQMIVKSTATMFASMVNPKYRGANFKFTPENISRMAFTGFFACGYNSDDRIKLYDGLPDTMTLEEFWKKESMQYASELLDHSGLLEKE